MRNSWKLFRHDLHHSTTNVMAIVVLAGLILIPSLFTWFNVIATWDPFGNTKNLTVAVANTDQGYQSDLIPLRVNIGEQALSSLRANNDLNWVITTRDDAIEGTRSGEYYAALVLPPEFSADMMTFYEDGGERTAIEYYTNEKKNAIAPNITEQGATEVSTNINEQFSATLGEVGLRIISSLSKELNDADTQVALSRLEARVNQVAAQLRAGADTADMFAALIASSTPLVRSASDLATSSGRALSEASEAIDGGADAARSLTSALTSAAGSLGGALSASDESYQAVSDRIEHLYASLDTQSGSTADAIDAVATRVQIQIDQYVALRASAAATVGPVVPDTARGDFDLVLSRLDNAIARQQALMDGLEDAARQLRSANADTGAARQQALGLVADARAAIGSAKTAYDTSLKPKLEALGSTLASIDAGITAVGDDVSSATTSLSSGSNSLLDRLSEAESTTSSISDSLVDAAGRFDELSAALAEASDTGDLRALTDLIGSDPGMLATSLSKPVELERVPVFSVASFGSAMTPLYMMLGLWVGALLASVAIRVDVPVGTLPGVEPLTPEQTYLGRYGIFALVGFAQSTLVSVGVILFVRIEPAHPWLLVLAAWVMSLVFTLITYTLVVAFGNAGKALSVLLLVFQIAGSGGAYPLQVLPQWFQNISPFLPGTHAVNAVRSAIAGVYAGDYWISLAWLVLFVVPMLLLGFVLRRPLLGVHENMLRELESTKLM
ncbi:YhgE/Pip domain-containing protein [Dietzia sp. ANT_WB102]|uniref:YhgE/Pip domain-containing protein n=1 Tax=Dietzia sp. ANT_WB102 TaxID=2597345 RepID=UPI0011ED90AA|nr:YhgE/Pip domain-containing protein [Dietzia sp. ANT_WB102]KAA0918329.1 YhgE/Pip domain-containing protein [Dietzia sp. ANT_WB102]